MPTRVSFANEQFLETASWAEAKPGRQQSEKHYVALILTLN